MIAADTYVVARACISQLQTHTVAADPHMIAADTYRGSRTHIAAADAYSSSGSIFEAGGGLTGVYFADGDGGLACSS